jgi:hypothetical protein
VVPGDGDGERLIDRQLARARLDIGGHGHQVELGLGLRNREGRQREEDASYQ